jgi:hypothetical protein
MIMQRLRRNPAALGLSISATLLIGLLLYEVILNRFTVISREEDLLRGFETGKQLIETALEQLFK